MAIPLKYNLRSLLVRRVSTAMTAGGIALVVAVFVIVMALVAGLNTAIADAGSPDNMIVLRRGATTETYSAIQLDQFEAMRFLPQVRREPDGQVDASPELAVQLWLERAGGGTDYIVVRGVRPIALKVHDKVKIVEGRMFNPSVNEVIVGRGLVGRYKDCTVGSTLRFGRGTWKVVGIFTSGGSTFESEVWGDLHNVQDDAQRGDYYGGVRLKVAPGTDTDALIRRIADDPRINLQAQTEPDYYKDQAIVANRMRTLGMIVAIIMAVGAIFGAMNTMYAAVSARTGEIATLRALGFTPSAVMTSFLIESVALALGAGLIGIVLAMPINGLSTTFGNFVTFSTLAFSFRVTFLIVIEAVIFAAVMGAMGGWLPARQAMKMPVTDALRRV
ncbi:MAG TPA: ABC transporter permease [Candidatus Binataceae bacterium]|nr:ABC transporter permease [Candidatus Binataceae bacterium]